MWATVRQPLVFVKEWWRVAWQTETPPTVPEPPEVYYSLGKSTFALPNQKKE